MSRWIPESSSHASLPAARVRTSYLQRLGPVVRERAAAYVEAQPEGEQVVLACLEAVGLPTLEALRGDRAIGTTKRDFAMLVTQALVDLYGPSRVLVLRRPDGRASTRYNPRGELPWIFSYTPQRVVASAS